MAKDKKSSKKSPKKSPKKSTKKWSTTRTKKYQKLVRQFGGSPNLTEMQKENLAVVFNNYVVMGDKPFTKDDFSYYTRPNVEQLSKDLDNFIDNSLTDYYLELEETKLKLVSILKNFLDLKYLTTQNLHNLDNVVNMRTDIEMILLYP